MILECFFDLTSWWGVPTAHQNKCVTSTFFTRLADALDQYKLGKGRVEKGLAFYQLLLKDNIVVFVLYALEYKMLRHSCLDKEFTIRLDSIHY